jgi:phosphoribosyl 1,2-cyclic phosphate phosphodiesterase
MRFVFLGTAASEGYPDAFCACDNCEKARQAGGPSLRKRCAALIDDELLIDLGPDLMAASMQHGVSLAKVRYCVQTHEHSDHLDPSHLLSRSSYCGVMDAPRLHFYASRQALGRAARILHNEEPDALPFDTALFEATSERLNLNVHVVEPFQHFAVGPYQLYSLKANHAHETTALLYLIQRGGRVIFYGTDTGEMPEETWDALESYGRGCDLVILDHTFGFKKRATTHLNAEQFLEQVVRLREKGLLAEKSRVVATHIGHHSNPTHPELVEFAARHGYEVAYDGMVIEL